MVALNTEEKRIVDLFHKLPPERRAHVMLAIAGADPDGWKRYQQEGERELRRLAAERGMSWDAMSDEQRQDFATEVLGFEVLKT